MTYNLARAKAEAAFSKFLERHSRDESEWLGAAVDYLRTITEGLVAEYLPAFAINPDLDLQCFHAGIDSAIKDLWTREFCAQVFINDFNYGRDGSEYAFKWEVRTPEMEALWKQTVTDFWSRHAAYLEHCERSGKLPIGDSFCEVAVTGANADKQPPEAGKPGLAAIPTRAIAEGVMADKSKQDATPQAKAETSEHPGFDGEREPRPEVCFVRWGPMDGEPTPLRLSHTGFLLANDGIAAHDISIEEFVIGDESWTAGTVARIKRDGEGFTLVFSTATVQRWNLLGAMHHAWSVRVKTTGENSNYAVRICALYRDAANIWYQSWADLIYIPTPGPSLGLLQFGPTVFGLKSSAIARPPQEGGIATETGIAISPDARKSMNLTAQQKDLLIAIVDRHFSGSGAPFMFTWSHSGSGFSSEGPPAPPNTTEGDFRHLQAERLITMEPSGQNVIRGKLTQLGINTAAKLQMPSPQQPSWIELESTLTANPPYWDNPTPLYYFDRWPLKELGVTSCANIKAGLGKIQAKFLENKIQGDMPEEVYCWREAYDVFATEFENTKLLNEGLIRQTIPAMVADASTTARWSRGRLGSVRPTGVHTVRFGQEYYHPDRIGLFLKLIDGRFAEWTAKLELQHPTAPSSVETAPDASDPALCGAYPERAAWFQNELAIREWSVHELQAQGGPDWKTSRKILDGLSVSRSVLEKTAAALSKKKRRVLLSEIPQK